MGPTAPRPLSGVRVIEIASFVAVPLAGMTLAQLGADVVRVDPVGGAADYRRWPVTEDGTSIYWTGLNKGKRSVVADLRAPEGQHLVQRLIVESGVVLTNMAGRHWLSFDTLVSERPDLIHLEVLGRADGSTAVDYTVNAATGFPLVTGPAAYGAPINHVLPAWDIACGLHGALAVVAALHRRDRTGEGCRIRLALEDVALGTASALGFLTEAMVNGTRRERIGNALYGQYGQTFTGSDGASFMVVTLTDRHFRDLTELTGTTKVIAALAQARDIDFTDEGQRFRHREVLTGLFNGWFAERTGPQIEAALGGTSLLWDRYRSFAEVATDERLRDNAMFTALHQPRVGDYLAAGLPASLDGAHPPAVAAPELGADTGQVLAELGMTIDDIDRLRQNGTVATD
ncbi:CoA transferase [Mycolicibacter sinensis]|jgi:2-methylfumaryl-CoA isomerase|uniref:Mesaconyl-CoA isomerase n=1 Tax=Mycolicibacter sinensis (strain JDM601) TaxID=875328 RepID=A0A1A2E2E7_MYCSD|nr:CoA transferase [Mycolicibacter sinensis]OBF98294.1 mesaconyl-CoA isomerase [Mycolicibacter sinensis]OBG09235.1 mesaconyl-CoA isomerase [Mycolicibacter sinensis]